MKLTIHHDDCADSPREYTDSTMICWHRRYNLGDEHGYADAEEFLREFACEFDDDLEEWIDHQENQLCMEMVDDGIPWEYVGKFIGKRIAERCWDTVSHHCAIVPVFMYEHSGVALSTGGFSCPWDSGQVGYIYYTNKQVGEFFAGDRGAAERALEMECQAYGWYINGDVQGYTVEDDDGEVVDSCWGFIGPDPATNGIREAVTDGGNDWDELVKDMEYAR